MPLCFIEPQDAIRVIAESVGREARRQLLGELVRAWVDEIPEGELQVSMLGEKLSVERVDGAATYSQAGRPIAVVSNVMLEYRPGPPPKPPKKTGRGR